jgi:hypothetical protein
MPENQVLRLKNALYGLH